MDHLEGKLFIDYLRPLRRQMITRKMEKLKRDRARDAGTRDGALRG
jgi:peptide deformylase